MKRRAIDQILKDLSKKMVFITGPRQVGKTWLAKAIAEKYRNPIYLNYDSFEDKEIIKNRSWPLKTDLLVLDEIHKMPDWKNFVKGVFDTKKNEHILVTGSARLEAFKSAGESLAGRYFRHRLFPFSLAELTNENLEEKLEKLLIQGGFPEPFLAANEIEAQRWRKQYSEGLIREDILDFERIHDFRAVKTLFELLRSKVGSPLSLNSLAEDLNISSNTVKKYIRIFEDLFIVFLVTPFSKNITRSIKKEPKVYFYDTGLVKGDEGARFENFVALSLLKHQCFLEDNFGIEARLHYLRTKEKKEVDFVLTKEGEAKAFIEAKVSSKNIAKDLSYFHKKYEVPSFQVTKELRLERSSDNIHVVQASKFLGQLEKTEQLQGY